MPTICPPLRWRPLVWLTTSPVAPSVVADELRASLFNRMASLFSSAGIVLSLAVAVAVRHPSAPFIAWAALDAAVSLVLVLSGLAILRHRAGHAVQAAPGDPVPDIYIMSGLLWFAVLGYGSGLCLASGEMGVSVIGCLLATATTGAQSGRVPGAPRLVMAHIAIICLPFAVGGCWAPDMLMKWGMLAVPAYLFTAHSINRQLHRDYVEMIVGRYESRLMALRCPLTGLANRRAFDCALADALAGPARARATVVLSLDLDGFKSVNDAYGHLAGDLLLRQVGERLLCHVPAGGLAARVGGDEFAVLAQGAGAAAAEQLARVVLAALQEPFLISGNPASIGVSIGLARATASSTPERLLGEADRALYAAKRGGKNGYCWFTAADAALQVPAPDAAGLALPGADQGPRALLSSLQLS